MQNNPQSYIDPSGRQQWFPRIDELYGPGYEGPIRPNPNAAPLILHRKSKSPSIEPQADNDSGIPDGCVVGKMINITWGCGLGFDFLNFPESLLPFEDQGLINVMGFGTETVYDFVHKQKQEFQVVYYGWDPLQVMGIEFTRYEGLTKGFQEVASVNDYGGLSLYEANPLNLGLSLSIVEVGVGMGWSQSVTRPGVDVTVLLGASLEIGLSLPGVLLEEGALGAYAGLVAARPMRSRSEDIPDFSTMEGEIRRSTKVMTFIAIAAARFWYTVDGEVTR